MAGIVSELLDILDLEPLEADRFRGLSLQTGWFRVFGGQVVAQALVAASRTVPESRPPHSLHAYFLLGGDPKAPIDYVVERIRDGRSFSTRRVVAHQHERPIFTMSVSYHDAEEGASHQAAMPDVPPPEDVPEAPAATAEAARHGLAIPAPILSYFGRRSSMGLRLPK
jgi:acyl-CoA thioesterase-2